MKHLKRVVGIPGSVVIGLGSILGTGVFVSIAFASEIAGSAIVLAVVIAGAMASFNGFSSAGLAAAHPVSGGSYEYGYRFVAPSVGFVAGWMFLIAKSASAATAALGFAGYLWGALAQIPAIGRLFGAGPAARAVGETAGIPVLLTILTAVVVVFVLTAVVAAGIRRSGRANAIIVTVTVGTLLLFVAFGIGPAVTTAGEAFQTFMPEGGIPALLHATALVFVAFTGYGRIATLGEEVRRPKHTIPRAIILTLMITVLLYVGVAFTGFATVPDAAGLPADGAVAPLALRAAEFVGTPGLVVLSAGAVAAMAGVLLNLVLGLSRVLLAMGRRRDMPALFERLDRSGNTPLAAVWAVGIFVALLTLIGDVRTTWSFSAFTVLVYYAITNFAALRIPDTERIFPKWISVLGLIGCVVPAFFLESAVWLGGLGLIAAGFLWHAVAVRLRTRT